MITATITRFRRNQILSSPSLIGANVAVSVVFAALVPHSIVAAPAANPSEQAEARSLEYYATELERLPVPRADQFYRSNASLINALLEDSSDVATQERVLWRTIKIYESRMVDKTLLPHNRLIYREKFEVTLLTYVDWFKGLTDDQLRQLPSTNVRGVAVLDPVIQFGRIQTVVEDLFGILVTRKEWGQVDTLVSSFPVILYLNHKSMEYWHTSLVEARIPETDSSKYKEFWSTVQTWATSFPLPQHAKARWLSQAETFTTTAS